MREPISITKYWPAAAALGLYWLTLAVFVGVSMFRNDGHFVYPLDDTYIHMAIAKNAAVHQVWGITKYGFSSSTSSPLWTLLLALTYRVIGVNIAAPLVWNTVAGTLLIATTYVLLRRRGLSAFPTLIVLIAIVFGAALPTVSFIGMEHTLHGLLTIWLAFGAAAALASERSLNGKQLAMLGGLSALVVGVRYEGAFTVAVVALMFVFRRRFLASAVAIVGGVLLPVAYGALSVSQGWEFLPNSVLLKSKIPEASANAVWDLVRWSRALGELRANPHLLGLILAALVALAVLVIKPSGSRKDMFLLSIVLGATLLHVQMAATGGFFRYEAYLLMLGITVVGIVAATREAPIRRHEHFGRYAAVLVVLAISGVPLAERGLQAVQAAPQATSNIYHQQYQMGRFLARFYPGRAVALNDIGMVNYLADVQLLDLFGLGSLEPARLKRSGEYRTARIGALADDRGVAVAAIYPRWLDDYGGVPPGWQLVGEWSAPNNIVLGGNAVAFFAVRPVERAPLIHNLKLFSGELPLDVMQSGEYWLGARSR